MINPVAGTTALPIEGWHNLASLSFLTASVSFCSKILIFYFGAKLLIGSKFDLSKILVPLALYYPYFPSN